MHLAAELLLLAATLTTGLVAGLLYVFAHAVMPGLGIADDRLLVTAFQRIDAAIGNPWMMVTFLGSPVLTAAALVVDLAGDRTALPWLVAALVLVLATVLITGIVHVPLNQALQDVDTDDPAATAAGRRAFERRWVRWNVARTVTSIASFTALAAALLVVG